jgi:hypothetical protein
MISTAEQQGDSLPSDIDVQAKTQFINYAKENENSLTEKEFYNFIGDFISGLKKGAELVSAMKDENFFGVHLHKGEEKMCLEDFQRAFREVWIMREHGDDEVGLDFEMGELFA